MTKQELRSLNAKAREARMWAGEQVAKAAHCAEVDDLDGFERHMAEARRLALMAGDIAKSANVMAAS